MLNCALGGSQQAWKLHVRANDYLTSVETGSSADKFDSQQP